jgi:hypothetical protein
MVVAMVFFIITQHTGHTIKVIVNAVFDITVNLKSTTPAMAAIVGGYRMALAILFCGHNKPSLKHIFYVIFEIIFDVIMRFIQPALRWPEP